MGTLIFKDTSVAICGIFSRGSHYTALVLCQTQCQQLLHVLSQFILTATLCRTLAIIPIYRRGTEAQGGGHGVSK